MLLAASSPFHQTGSSSHALSTVSASSPRRSAPLPLPAVVYLNTSQARLGATNACATNSCYVACYLLYSTTPKAASIVEYLRKGSSDWLMGLELRHHDGWLEHPTVPLARHPFIKASMEIDAGLEANGLMLATEELYAAAPEEYQNPDYLLFKGLAPALERLARFVAELPVWRARSFCFSRAKYTMAGCVRRVPDGPGGTKQLRWDLFDPHERTIAGFAPEQNTSSAVWITCFSLADAVGFIEHLFPPSIEVDSLYQADVRVNPRKPETNKIPGPMYALVVFKPKFDSAEQASSYYERQMVSQDYVVL